MKTISRHTNMKVNTLLSLCVLLASAGLAVAQGTTAFTYQGRLNDPNGPANGTYDFQSLLCTNGSSGPPLAGFIAVNAGVVVSNGLFTMQVQFLPTPPFAALALWLELSVRTNGSGSYTTLSPRQRLTPTPYAVYSASAGSFSGVLAGDVRGTQGATTVGVDAARIVIFVAEAAGTAIVAAASSAASAAAGGVADLRSVVAAAAKIVATVDVAMECVIMGAAAALVGDQAANQRLLVTLLEILAGLGGKSDQEGSAGTASGSDTEAPRRLVRQVVAILRRYTLAPPNAAPRPEALLEIGRLLQSIRWNPPPNSAVPWTGNLDMAFQALARADQALLKLLLLLRRQTRGGRQISMIVQALERFRQTVVEATATLRQSAQRMRPTDPRAPAWGGLPSTLGFTNSLPGRR